MPVKLVPNLNDSKGSVVVGVLPYWSTDNSCSLPLEGVFLCPYNEFVNVNAHQACS